MSQNSPVNFDVSKYSILSMRYARALYELGINDGQLIEIKATFSSSNELLSVMLNPTVSLSAKHHIIDRLFHGEIVGNFLKLLCDHNSFALLFEIINCAKEIIAKENKILKASLTYVTPPTDKQRKQLKAFICQRHNCSDVIWDESCDESLIGGFTLFVDGIMYNKSLKGGFDKFAQGFGVEI